MHKSVLAFGVIAALLPFSAAHAGMYAQDLSKCMVSHLTKADLADMSRYEFVLLSENPAAKPYVNMSDAQHKAILKTYAELNQRLLTEACHTESVAALKYEGADAFSESFNLLGQVTIRSLLSNDGVRKDLCVYSSFFDKKKIQSLFREAGLPVVDDTKAADDAKSAESKPAAGGAGAGKSTKKD